MSRFDCIIGVITSAISIVGALFGSNGGVYCFVCLAFIYCLIDLIDDIRQQKER